MVKIDCNKCKEQNVCCDFGSWIDLEEAKNILALGVKGEFYQIEADSDFPSGYRVGTSFEDEPCTFIRKDGLCPIHIIDYGLKPASCKDFPYEDGKLSPFAKCLCNPYRRKLDRRARKKKK